MERQTLELFFPDGGVDKTSPYVSQPPHTSVDLLNVIPQDTAKGRYRGGSRMGLEKHTIELFGSGSPIRLLAQMVTDIGEPQLVLVSGQRLYNEVASNGIVSEGTWRSDLPGLSLSGRMCYAMLGDSIYIADSGSANPVKYTAGDAGGSTHNNPVADPLGDVPLNCSVVANIGDRLVFAGDSTDQRAYYMSRPGDANDFAYGDTDEERAITGTLAIPGANNGAIKAVIPWYADYSLWCCEDSMTLMIGDNLATGAYFYPISTRLGTLDSMSWCKGPGLQLFVMTKDGLAICYPSDPRSEPKLASPEKMPRELLAISSSYEVRLVWDSRAKGVHIFVTKTEALSGVDHWFWSERGGYFRMRYPTSCEPFSVCSYPSLTSIGTNILLGCRDGRLRRFSLTATDDDGTAFDAYAYLGPFRPSGNDFEDGRIVELIGVMSTDSSDVDVDIFGGANPEEAYASTTAWNNTLPAGRSSVHRPRTRAGDAYIKVSGVDWGMEKVIVKTSSGGRQR